MVLNCGDKLQKTSHTYKGENMEDGRWAAQDGATIGATGGAMTGHKDSPEEQ